MQQEILKFANKRQFDNFNWEKKYKGISCIIRFINNINGKVFIGYTKNIVKYSITQNLYKNEFLIDALEHYGRCSFSLEIIPFLEENILEVRDSYIKELGTNTYNINCSIDKHNKEDEEYLEIYSLDMLTNIGKYSDKTWKYVLQNDKRWVDFIIEKNLIPKYLIDFLNSIDLESIKENIVYEKIEYKGLMKIEFGKYKGQRWSKIIKDDVNYITWVINSTKDISLKEFLIGKLYNE